MIPFFSFLCAKGCNQYDYRYPSILKPSTLNTDCFLLSTKKMHSSIFMIIFFSGAIPFLPCRAQHFFSGRQASLLGHRPQPSAHLVHLLRCAVACDSYLPHSHINVVSCANQALQRMAPVYFPHKYPAYRTGNGSRTHHNGTTHGRDNERQVARPPKRLTPTIPFTLANIIQTVHSFFSLNLITKKLYM